MKLICKSQESSVDYQISNHKRLSLVVPLIESVFDLALRGGFQGLDKVPAHLWAKAGPNHYIVSFCARIEQHFPACVRQILKSVLARPDLGKIEEYCFVHAATGYTLPPDTSPDRGYYLLRAAEQAREEGTLEHFPGAEERIFFSWGSPSQFGLKTLKIQRTREGKIQVGSNSAWSDPQPEGELIDLMAP